MKIKKKENEIIEYYNNFSNSYDDFYYKLQIIKLETILSQFNFSENLTIFDLGGGTGILSEFVRNNIINFDISLYMLKMGKIKQRIFQSILCDIQKLPIRSKSSNLIFSITAIQNLSQPELLIQEISRILKTRSFGVISILNKFSNNFNLEDFFKKYNLDIRFKFQASEDSCYIFTAIN